MLLTGSLFLLLSFCGYGQQFYRFDEEEYVRMVLDSNYNIQSARWNVEAAGEEVRSVRKDLYPAIDLDFFNIYSEREVTNEGMPVLRQDFYKAGVGIGQNLYSGGIVRRQIELAEIFLQESLSDQEITENEILYLAKLKYWTVVSAMEQMAIWQEYRRRYEEFYQTIVDRVEASIVSKNEQLTAHVQLEQINLQILDIERTSELAMFEMKRLAKLNTADSLILGDSIIISTVPAEIIDPSAALSKRPEIMLMEKRLEASMQLERIISSSYAPSIGVGLDYFYTNGILDQPDGDFNYNITARATLPLIRWGKKKNELAMQKAYSQAAQFQLDDQIQNVRFDVAKSQYKLEQSVRQVNLARQAAYEARENLQIYINRYDEGLASIVEVTEAQTFLQDALLLLFRYRTEYQFNLIELERAQGELQPE
ncbi:MAG: TolC family protein [Cyclobacteriaceae bacterium]